MYLQFNYQRPGDNANNGNVYNVYDLLNGNNWQAFTYDTMNRMKAFSGQVNGNAQSRTYTLDRYGNMSDSYNPLAFNTANNRITTTGYGYDYAGNLTTEPQRAYSYDGENRLRLAVVNGITVGQYLYDGDGRRAKRITPQETRYYIHDALGNAVFEYKVNAGYDTFNHFHNGRLTATVTPSDNLLWVYSDHLGTPRLKATPTGGALSSDWYEPFGRAINTPADGMKYRFTAKERDAESGLDYFGARYYSGAHDRFSTADPYMPSADVKDPQSWNRYTYARNNPLRYIDPNGLDWSDLSSEQRRVFQSYATDYCKQHPEFCEANAGSGLNESIYNTLDEAQMSTYESVTYALEHTELVDSEGNSMGNALQQVTGVTDIAGETLGSSKGDTQFRLYANLKPRAIETFGKAEGFNTNSNRIIFRLLQPYHKGFPDSFRQTRKEGVKGMEAGLQPSYNRKTLRSDIDVDYRFGTAHLYPANSDVRAPGNYQKFIDRWPGFRNWWDK